MKKLLTISTLLVSVCMPTLAWSSCQEAQAPGLPNPDLAGEAEMLRAQREVLRYIALQEQFLDCVRNTRMHNQAVERMHEVANKYNSTARRYKARMQSLNMITELALLEF